MPARCLWPPARGRVARRRGEVRPGERGGGEPPPEGVAELLRYPENITLGNLAYFLAAPTLCYQPVYPRRCDPAAGRAGWDCMCHPARAERRALHACLPGPRPLPPACLASALSHIASPQLLLCLFGSPQQAVPRALDGQEAGHADRLPGPHAVRHGAGMPAGACGSACIWPCCLLPGAGCWLARAPGLPPPAKAQLHSAHYTHNIPHLNAAFLLPRPPLPAVHPAHHRQQPAPHARDGEAGGRPIAGHSLFAWVWGLQ